MGRSSRWSIRIVRATSSTSEGTGGGWSEARVSRNDNLSSSCNAPYRAVKSVNSPEVGGRAKARCRMGFDGVSPVESELEVDAEESVWVM